VLPDEPPPVRLMNTLWADRYQVHDALDSAAALVEWLAVTGLVPQCRATSADLASARSLRDALRRLAAVATEDDRPSPSLLPSEQEALAELNAIVCVAHVPPGLQRGDAGWERSPAFRGRALSVALASVALDAVALLVAPSPLRACRAPGCVLYFVQDHPRRAWCSEGCGNRVRAARHYARSRAHP
jgi:predicted RNA-binding Zn ribbon-like protein